MIAAGFASFFTGVTEPIEFAFMFVAPVLYLIHAVLTGIAVFLAASFNWMAGFGFSAGFVDFFLAVLTGIAVFLAASFNWMAGFGFSAGFVDFFLSLRNPNASQPYMLIVLGLIFFVLYYVIFSFAIAKFNIKTPGREDDVEADEMNVKLGNNSYSDLAAALLPLLGGKENIVSVDNCITRLRLEVKDSTLTQDAEIKKIFTGVLKPSKTNVQVIVGTEVQFVADELKKLV